MPRPSKLRIAIAAALIASATPVSAQQPQQRARYGARQLLDDRLSVIERQVVPAADAMPDSLYDYKPAGGAFAGVRTFAEQLTHLAAANWQLGSQAMGQQPPTGTHDETAPASVHTRAQIIEYLRGSFACLHRAIATVNDDNLTRPVGGLAGTWQRTRLGLIIDAMAHASDHYGQIVEYLRANGIVPPASR